MNTISEPIDRQIVLILTFAITLFISATLMFVLQPMFGKILLPLLGGSPAVWNTCMVFYQTILFLGYLYAHYLSTRLDHRKQLLAHIGVIIISLIALPVGLSENVLPPTDSNPSFWIIWTLLVAIGLPFFVVSTTAPLMQKWFANVGHHTSDDPYYLYAASNAGSLLALLSYPFLIEPNIGLNAQKAYWSGGYVLLGICIAGCGFYLWRSQEKVPEVIEAELEEQPLSLMTKLHWLALAFVPSSLLLGLTNFISTDVASVPLLWIIPLTLYLLTFIIVFSKWGKLIHPWMVSLQPLVLLPFIAFSFINPAILPFWVDLLLHLSAFFLAVMVCHGELARLRPHTKHLTFYYLMMSFAGMLGGMFNTFVAPFIFTGVYEYSLMIVASLLLRPGLSFQGKKNWQEIGKELVIPAIVFVSGILLYALTDHLGKYIDIVGAILILLVGFSYAFRDKTISLALLTGCIIFFTIGLHNLLTTTIHKERTFFGVLSVRVSKLLNEQNKPEKFHEFYHGTTKHGAQRLPQHLQTVPTTYFSRQGPIGQVFNTFDSINDQWDIGVVGLGAGTLACYAKPTQNWVFYELDPTVVEVAKNPKYFTYLQKCGRNMRMSVGDARLSIMAEPDKKFDLLIIDAFSSDSIPTHLLTQEAMQLYFSKLKNNGILAFHITNRHLALKKVISDHSKRLSFFALIQEFKVKRKIPLVSNTDWVVMSKNDAMLAPLKKTRPGNWQKLPLYFDLKPWTDDFTNIVSIWK